MKKYLLYILTLAATSACIYPYDVELDSAPEKTVVVDGEIVVGGTTTINLSYLVPLNGVASARQAHGQAQIEDENGKIYKPTSSASTTSISIPMDNAPSGVRYRATITVDGETYQSDWIEPKAPPVIKNIGFSADEDFVSVTVDLEAGEDGTGYIGLTYEECWEFHSDFYPELFINPLEWFFYTPVDPYPYYWCWMYEKSPAMVLLDYTKLSEGSSINNYPIHSFLRTDGRNHRMYSILVKARTLSEENYRYINYLDEVSNSGTDLFTPEPGQMQGNLHCESDKDRPVMGLVQASELVTKRVFLNSKYQKSKREDDGIFVEVTPDKYRFFYYSKGYRPVKTVSSPDGTFDGWAPERCINCIVAGGTQVKPDFWDEAPTDIPMSE